MHSWINRGVTATLRRINCAEQMQTSELQVVQKSLMKAMQELFWETPIHLRAKSIKS